MSIRVMITVCAVFVRFGRASRDCGRKRDDAAGSIKLRESCRVDVWVVVDCDI